ncbi:hypothetical protein DEJ50_31190 [Streptomyces venezuelae]|uniref:Uncharacterized protein n=1 Tax=Streptomyces venezuelae TaxID=54571 RepID=A0A5P2DA73_STRVZ|nr:hypothetical protein [Streptomyces venezuelae]QES51653.1 hypothetical protein DEJ50_31190 [Streptomyces venezuelae]
MHDVTRLWPVVASTEADWLAELCEDDGILGFPVPGRPDAAWVLNPMYESELGPGVVSHDELLRADIAAGDIEVPSGVGGVDFSQSPVGVATGGGLGRAEHPGPGWRRLRWAELAERTGDPVVAEGQSPSYLSAPDGRLADRSWPVGIRPPTEGSLDRETWNRLIRILTDFAPDGPDTRCFAYFCPILTQDWDDLRAYRVVGGRLGDALALYDYPGMTASPSNLWAAERSWVTYTDQDLWGTKVAGPPELVRRLVEDTEIEAVRLPWDT